MTNQASSAPVAAKPADAPTHTPARLLRRGLAAAVIVVALLAVFVAYLRPAMAFQMAQQLWSCF